VIDWSLHRHAVGTLSRNCGGIHTILEDSYEFRAHIPTQLAASCVCWRRLTSRGEPSQHRHRGKPLRNSRSSIHCPARGSWSCTSPSLHAARTQVIPTRTHHQSQCTTCKRGALNGDLSSIVSQTTHIQFIVGLRVRARAGRRTPLFHELIPAHDVLLHDLRRWRKRARPVQNGEHQRRTEFSRRTVADTTGTNVHGLQYPFVSGRAECLRTPPPVSHSEDRSLQTTWAASRSQHNRHRPDGRQVTAGIVEATNASTCSSNGAGPQDYLFLPFPFFHASRALLPLWRLGPTFLSSGHRLSVTAARREVLRLCACGSPRQRPNSGQRQFRCAVPTGSSSLQATLSDKVKAIPTPGFAQWNPIPQWIRLK